jgi:hypothetical protein
MREMDFREVDPELKRIVNQLSCSQHQFVYCPCCKDYSDNGFDPVSNIRRFMLLVKEDKIKLKLQKLAKRKKTPQRSRSKMATKRSEVMPEDSVSEITDLSEEEIMSRFQETLSKAEKIRKEREKTWKRLQSQHKCFCVLGCNGDGHHSHYDHSHKHNLHPPKEAKRVKVELRGVTEGVSMQDDCNSAHQFSLHDASA